MKRLSLLMLAAACIFALTAFSALTGQAQASASKKMSSSAKKELTVEIGKTAAAAEKAQSHDITEEALKNGQSDYSVQAMGHSYKIALDQAEIKDILGGTTVMVPTAEGGMVVKITLKAAAKKKGGW